VPVGDRLRISGSAEITGFDTEPAMARAEAIIANAGSTFPQLLQHLDRGKARFWAGLRPVTPAALRSSAAPKSVVSGFNAGHGHLGWTLACGSGRVIADLMNVATPAFPCPGRREPSPRRQPDVRRVRAMRIGFTGGHGAQVQAATRINRGLARPGADAHVALKLLVQRAIAGVREQAAALQRRQLALRRHDDDVVAADAADGIRADLLIAAPEDVALAADDADDDLRRPSPHQFRDLRAREIQSQHLPSRIASTPSRVPASPRWLRMRCVVVPRTRM